MPVPNAPATYSWQGKGLLRLFTARWEVLGFEEREEGRGWLLTFQHKTIFTAPAVNIACRTKTGLDKEVLGLVEDWLRGLGDEALKKALKDMYLIEHN